METIIVALIAGLSTAVPSIIATLSSNKKTRFKTVEKNIKKELDTMESNLKADNLKTRKQLNEETLNRCKVDLINVMSRIQNGYKPTEEERRILIEEKEQYNKLGGDSYVDDMFERLKKEGNL